MSKWQCAVLAATIALGATSIIAQQGDVRRGVEAFGDWRSDAPGVRRHIAPADVPPSDMPGASANPSRREARPDGVLPKVPAGFSVTLFASGLRNPRAVRTAPNGNIFLSETSAGRVRVLRAGGCAEGDAE